MAASPIHIDPSMKTPLISSVGFHILILILATVGIPFMVKTPPITNTPITVELVELGKITQNPTPPAPSPPAQPKVTAETPPDLTEPEKPKEVKKELPEPEPLPEPVKKTEVAKEEPKKPEKKPDPEVTKTEKAEPKPDFASLLKNLTPDLEENKPVDTPNPIDQVIENASKITNLGDQLTMSEKDAVLAQLAKCWNVMAGAEYAEDLVVQVQVKINSDRTVNQATIVDQGRYNRDSAFRAAGDSALRALRNPNCSPLALPPDKYNEWKTTIINFDPREML